MLLFAIKKALDMYVVQTSADLQVSMGGLGLCCMASPYEFDKELIIIIIPPPK